LTNVAGLSNGAISRGRNGCRRSAFAIDVPEFAIVPPSCPLEDRGKAAVWCALIPCSRFDTEGVVGETFLAVRPGTSRGGPAPDLATIPSTEPVELSELLTRGTGLLNDAQSMLTSIGGKLAGTLDTANATLSNVNDIAMGLRQGRGPAGLLLTDDTLAKQIRQTVALALVWFTGN